MGEFFSSLCSSLCSRDGGSELTPLINNDVGQDTQESWLSRMRSKLPNINTLKKCRAITGLISKGAGLYSGLTGFLSKKNGDKGSPGADKVGKLFSLFGNCFGIAQEAYNLNGAENNTEEVAACSKGLGNVMNAIGILSGSKLCSLTGNFAGAVGGLIGAFSE